jgi:hypothetical protein
VPVTLPREDRLDSVLSPYVAFNIYKLSSLSVLNLLVLISPLRLAISRCREIGGRFVAAFDKHELAVTIPNIFGEEAGHAERGAFETWRESRAGSLTLIILQAEKMLQRSRNAKFGHPSASFHVE